MPGSTGATALAADLKRVQIGIFGGFFACLAYLLLAFVPLPKLATTALAALFGPALGLASIGLRRLLDWETPRVSSALAALSNALAGVLFSAMVLVQMAVGSAIGEKKPSLEVKAVWLGLDVAWDVYIGLGTLCFGLAMLGHPRFGRVFGCCGMAIAAGLLALNLWTFPTPPSNAGLIDLGPVIGLWYLVVTIRMWCSLSWARHHGAAARTC